MFSAHRASSFVRIASAALLVLVSFASPSSSNSLTSGSWVELVRDRFSDATMPKRYGHSVIYDSLRRRLVVFGGTQLDDVETLNDVWTLSLAGPFVWQKLVPAGTPPSPRRDHTAVYDVNSDRMIVFGGGTLGEGSEEIWSLAFSPTPSWTQLAPTGTFGSFPSPRSQHVAIYDSARDRMIVHGGFPYDTATYALSLADVPAWTKLPSVGGFRRRLHSAIYDRVHDRMLIFGGNNIFDSPENHDDVLARSFSVSTKWDTLQPMGTPPSIRNDQTAAYDPTRELMLVFGGQEGLGLDDVHALTLSGTPEWFQIATSAPEPDRRSDLGSVFDLAGDRFVIVGGLSENSPGSDTYNGANDAWALTLDYVPTAVPPAIGATRLLGLSPNPSSDHLDVRFSLAREGMVRIRVLDALGREVARPADRGFGPGTHVVAWNGPRGRGRVAAGVYFMIWEAPGCTDTRRFVIVR